MQQLITIFHVLAAIGLIILVLVQHGKGADMGATFGGASSTMFGSQGTTPFLVKITAILAFIFFLTSASLSFLVSRELKQADTVNITAPMEIPKESK
jgi:preprotein translocase subunit SecG